jgi:hypothetical protein
VQCKCAVASYKSSMKVRGAYALRCAPLCKNCSLSPWQWATL